MAVELRFRSTKWQVICALLCAFILCSCNQRLDAQSDIPMGTFELTLPGLNSPSIVTLTGEELVVREPAGAITRYTRSPRYDTADQAMIGYASRAAQQVILWPVNNSGRMRIGTLQNGRIQFDWSKMTISGTPNIGPANSGRFGQIDILPSGLDDQHLNGRNRVSPSANNMANSLSNLPQMTAMHLAAGGANQRQFLSLRSNNQFGFVNQATNADSAWYITPVSDNVVRIQQLSQNNWLAIGLDDIPDATAMNHRLGNRLLNNMGGAGHAAFRGHTGNLPISLLPIHNGADQLWRIQNIASAGGYLFESVLYPGMGLTCLPGRGLSLQPITYDSWQIWSAMPPVFALPQPQFRTVQRQIVPNPPLRPVSANLVNNHTDTVIVLVADRRNVQQLQKLRIPSRGSERIQLDRDAGGTIIETVETMDAFGNWNQQQYNTPIPPNVLYDMSVYEEFLQSIAIDRTGKSPNAIEDVNYQPRSIGFFLVPPGDELPELATIDVFRIAEDAQNPGAVRRLSQRDLQKNNAATPDPLKDLLNQFQKQRAAF